MGADLHWLKGKVEENPLEQGLNLDLLLDGLLKALITEQIADSSQEPVEAVQP